MEHGRSHEKRELAKFRLKERKLNWNYSTIQIDAYQTISEWYHTALLTALESAGVDGDLTKAADRLSLPLDLAVAAIGRMERLEMVFRTADGKYKASSTYMATTDGVPSAAIRKSHRQLIEKALNSIAFCVIK